MPELPEVETVRKAAEARLAGRVITGVDVRNPQLRRPVDIEGLQSACTGKTLTGVDRRGKFMIARLDGPRDLLLHLGMSGALHVLPAGTPLDAHEHVVWRLDDGFHWRFHDPRRFGSVELMPDAPDAPLPAPLAAMGPEPLDPAWTGADLHRELRKTSRAVKLALLDQHVVAGLGNIYVCEALFTAGVSPFRKANRISRKQCDKLASGIRGVLLDAIEHGGTSLRDYTRLDGSEGQFAVHLRVYGREGHPCPRCGPDHPVRRRVQQNRSTFHCPNCQH